MNHENHEKRIMYADDDYESVKTLFKLRAPALFIGLLLGIVISFVMSSFEEVLASNVQVAFFLPFIVYIADAIGTQTDAIYSRDLKTGRAKFSHYFKKELALGIIFGLIFGAVSGVIVFLWLKNNLLAISVATACFIAVMVAPIVALLVTQIFQSLREDPAAGAGPVATVIQDMTSVLIYGIVCSAILL